MERIPSFSKDHDKLATGLHLCGTAHGVTTWDLRFKKPNAGDYISPKALHTIEHIIATVLRNSERKDDVIYFGPMGCRTGFYLLLAGELESREILPLVTEMYRFIRDFRGEVPGASPKDCGNYLDMNLKMANLLAEKYLEVLEGITPDRLVYPA